MTTPIIKQTHHDTTLDVFTTRRLHKRWIVYALLVLWFGTALWQTIKPMPAGADVSSPAITADARDVKFLQDLTYANARGEVFHEQQIFDAVFAVIDGAQQFVVLDFFLFNADMGNATDAFRPLSRELTARLIAKKRASPQTHILLVTDPINDVYGGAPSPLLTELRAAGVDVAVTDLNRLRDSNPAYSSWWRLTARWFGNSPHGSLDNPFENGPSKISLRSWLALFNFKANHRKVIVADDATGNLVGIVSSANPHDASSAHSNVALRFTGEIAQRVLASELSIARISGWTGKAYTPALAPAPTPAPENTVTLQLVTEQAIARRLLQALNQTRNGDSIRLAMFYLSDRSIIDALLAAAARGVSVQLVLDPNRDAFGREKDGVPNRPVANELIDKSHGKIEVRWYRTHGEQFHSKLVLITQGDQLTAALGSANLTRRNIENYNLEANVVMQSPLQTAVAQDMLAYFDRLWKPRGAAPEITAPFGAFRDATWQTYMRYRLMEVTGVGTF